MRPVKTLKSILPAVMFALLAYAVPAACAATVDYQISGHTLSIGEKGLSLDGTSHAYCGPRPTLLIPGVQVSIHVDRATDDCIEIKRQEKTRDKAGVAYKDETLRFCADAIHVARKVNSPRFSGRTEHTVDLAAAAGQEQLLGYTGALACSSKLYEKLTEVQVAASEDAQMVSSADNTSE